MRHVWLFRVACVAVLTLWVVSSVVAVVVVFHRGDPWWYLFREPVIAGTVAAGIVGLLYWWCGAPGNKIWATAHDAGIREGIRRGAMAASGDVVVPIRQRRTSMS